MIGETATALATKLQTQLEAATRPVQNIERVPAGPKAGQGMVNETNAEKLSEKLGMNNGQGHDKKVQNVNNSSKVISTNANGHTNGTKQSLPGQNGHT